MITQAIRVCYDYCDVMKNERFRYNIGSYKETYMQM